MGLYITYVLCIKRVLREDPESRHTVEKKWFGYSFKRIGITIMHFQIVTVNTLKSSHPAIKWHIPHPVKIWIPSSRQNNRLSCHPVNPLGTHLYKYENEEKKFRNHFAWKITHLSTNIWLLRNNYIIKIYITSISFTSVFGLLDAFCGFISCAFFIWFSRS